MNLKQYIPLAIRTECDPGNPVRNLLQRILFWRKVHVKHSRVLHAIIGLCTETSELVDGLRPVSLSKIDWENVWEEIGDCFWYHAIYCDAVGGTFSRDIGDCVVDRQTAQLSRLTQGEWAIEASKSANRALDLVKKTLFYNKPLDEIAINAHVSRLMFCLYKITYESNWDIELIRKANLAKLAKRYGDKFSDIAALNRDTEAEMKAMSFRPGPKIVRCCERDDDGDGNCPIHSAPGVLRRRV